MLPEIERLLELIDERISQFRHDENYPEVYDLTYNKMKILILEVLKELLEDF